MTPLEYARAYTARGWSVFPLVPGTKRPAVELRPFLSGKRRATDAECVGWWGSGGLDGNHYGIGIVCGAPSGGLVVIDVDCRNGGDAAVVRARLGYEPECVVRTGGGGIHVYCHAEGDVPKGKTVSPGVDRQGTGSYVVAPPSVHPSGQVYVWE